MAISAPCCLSQSFFLVLEYMYLVYALHAGRSAGASNAVASSGSGVTAPHFLPHTTRAQQLPYQLTWLRAGQQRVQRRDTHTYAHLDVHEQIVRLFEDDADGHERWTVRNELIEVWNERAHEHQLPCRVDGIVPLRVENIVAVLREPGKCEALEPDNIELARQTPEQLELVEDRGELAVDAVLVRRIESFEVDTGGDGAVCSMATRVGHARNKVRDEAPCSLRVHTRLLTSHLKFTALTSFSGVEIGVFSRKHHEMCPFPPSNAVETITS